MKFEKIFYSESIEATNAFGNKKWFKSGTEITDINDEVAKATMLAKEYVSDTIKASLEANSSYVADPTTLISRTEVKKVKMDIVMLKKYQQAIKEGDVTTIANLEKQYNVEPKED